MKLYGRNYSPFVRRVATSLKLLGLPFEHLELSVVTERDRIIPLNPLVRVPALELDDGTVLIDSAAILDHIDESVGPDRALIPAAGTGSLRRDVLQSVALAIGACEKMVTAYYERTRRPAEFLYEPWASQCEEQARTALSVLDARVANGTPLHGGRLTQADVSAVIAYDFARLTSRDTVAPDGAFPALAAYAAALNQRPEFSSTQAS